MTITACQKLRLCLHFHGCGLFAKTLLASLDTATQAMTPPVVGMERAAFVSVNEACERRRDGEIDGRASRGVFFLWVCTER